MKKIIFIAAIAITVIFTGCGKDFMDQKNLYEKDLTNYYQDSIDVFEALVGAYSCLAIDEGIGHPLLIANLKSDECFAGGGTNDIECNAIDKFTNPVEDLFLFTYRRNYDGIFKINTLLANFENATYSNETLKDRHLGEAHFLRAIFYFRLAQLFGEVPLDLSPELEYLPKATVDEIYAQIAYDLNMAIENLPSVAATAMPTEEKGRATKWAAEALMARVYLFYTGFYGKPSLPTTEGENISQSQVVAWLNDCITNSGHYLLNDFRSIWPYSTLNTTTDGYAYADDVDWAGDGCDETVFAVSYSNQGIWNGTGRTAYCNQQCLYIGMRGGEYPPFGAGWGQASVNTELWDSFEPGDPRREGTIINVASEVTGYVWNGDNTNDETGLYNKKYNPIVRDSDGDGTYEGMYYELFGGLNANNQLWNMQDDILIRFSDVLLMHSELTETNDGLNQVRARVGLLPVAYSLQAIKDERYHELALEGLRYYDLLRWGDAEQVLNESNGVDVLIAGVPSQYSVSFSISRAFGKLPESQVRVSQGKLIQNPGWNN